MLIHIKIGDEGGLISKIQRSPCCIRKMMQACSVIKDEYISSLNLFHTLSEGEWDTKWLDWTSRGKEVKGWKDLFCNMISTVPYTIELKKKLY